MTETIAVIPTDEGTRLTQWDQSRYVGVPECDRVDFSMRGDRQCLGMLPEADGEVFRAQIPNQLLTRDGQLRIWTVEGGRATAFAAYPVHAKPRPPDYIDSPTGCASVYKLIAELDERVARLEEAVAEGGAGDWDIGRLQLALEPDGRLLLIDTRA